MSTAQERFEAWWINRGTLPTVAWREARAAWVASDAAGYARGVEEMRERAARRLFDQGWHGSAEHVRTLPTTTDTEPKD